MDADDSLKGMIFTLKHKPRWSLDLSALTPDRLSGAENIADIELSYGSRPARVGELFSISGDNPEHIELRRTTGLVTRIGAQMTRGHISVKAHGGSYLGYGMKGGTIRVNGNCGDWLGCEMYWGRIDVEGDAGDYIGAGTHTGMYGMRDGLITVWGNAGNRIGDRMRRGMIMIGGDAGDFSGSGMVAGTILILGKSGRLPGYGMKRGTIILGRRPDRIGTTLANCGTLKMEYLRLFFKQLSRMGSRYRFFRNFGPEVRLYTGDLANDGKGEVMVLLNRV
ncbi:MAG: formylmethanofuran dehydrogenase subunit C [Gammaproteobacteria bacterium]|nr:formylmethanofuran dehydrogenase subunit C [Gammaproteobacteria bacterium]